MAAVCDVLIEAILLKLPAKSLLRFKSVCKTWHSVISDPQFRRPGVFICENLRDFSTIRIESLLTKDRAAAPLSFLRRAEEPGDRYTACLGSCNGLVCVERKNDTRADRCGLIVCNPWTRKFKTLRLPRPYLQHHIHIWTYDWFGYDESIDDYKLVRLNFTDVSNPARNSSVKVAELDVFTLKSNTWSMRKVDHIAVHRRGDDASTGGVLCSKAIHWITQYRGRSRCLLVLDLAREKVRMVRFRHAQLARSAWLGSLDGERLWICDHVVSDGDSNMVSDLWVMKEYGVHASWTKVLSIRRAVRDEALRMYPIRLSKEGGETVVICNFKAGEGSSGHVVKLRVDEGGEEVKDEEVFFGVPRNPFASNIILPMEESLVSI